MKGPGISFLLFILVAATSMVARAQTAPTPAAKPEDVSSPDAIIASLYDVISGPAGQKRNWDRMRSLFLDGGRLVGTAKRQNGEFVHRTMTVDDYIATSGKSLEENGFFEQEIGRHTDVYGNMMQVFSSYSSKKTLEDKKPFARGINSIQLWNDGKRWWIVGVFWQSENPDQMIPAEFLNDQ